MNQIVTISSLSYHLFRIKEFSNIVCITRDNWTRLAAQEINRFQDEIMKWLSEEMTTQQPLQVAKFAGKQGQDNYEWSFAKAFLYSLTVLTTIGE